MIKRWVSALLVLLLLMALSPLALADFQKGRVSGNLYSSPDGISFLVPPGFTLSRQENRKAGFFRIVFSGPYDARMFGPAIVVDVIPSRSAVEDYTARKLVSDMEAYPVANVDKYQDSYVLSDTLIHENGLNYREVLVVYRLNRYGEARVAINYYYIFSTGKNLVRASYNCFAAQRTLTEDLPGFMKLFDSLIVP